MEINQKKIKTKILPTYQPVAQARKKLNFRFVKDKIDRPFLIIVLVLLVFGFVMMFSASYAWGLYDADDGYYYIKRQLFSGVLGLIGMFLVSYLDYHFYQNTKIAFLLFAGALALNFITAFVGDEVAGARRWITIAGMQFQPSEILKVAVIIIFSYILAVNWQKFDNWRFSIVPFAVILGFCAVAVAAQRHMSGVLIFGIIGLSMMFVGGVPKKYFWRFIGCLCIALAAFLIYKVFLDSDGGFSYITERFESWQNPKSDPQGSTYQTYQSLLAIGSGGIFGLGFGESRQKYLYLSESQNDFVFSIICEELGFVGACVVIILFAIFILRGFYIASRSRDRFGMLLAAGITIQIGSQALLNIAVATNAFPNTGISLPFFSYGGTALLIQLLEMGVLLSVSRQANKSP